LYQFYTKKIKEVMLSKTKCLIHKPSADWQEPLLRAAGVPIPADFSSSNLRKSYTLPASDGKLAIGVLCLVSI
jgi:hypothetical protein